MRSERWLRNSLIALLSLVVIYSVSKLGLPVSERVEEYLAFVLVTDFSHEVLAEQVEHLEQWSDPSGWWEGLRAVWERLKGLFASRASAAPAVDDPLATGGAAHISFVLPPER